MIVHIEFANGSNPVVKYCKNDKEATAFVDLWSIEYILKPLEITKDFDMYFLAKEKEWRN